MSACISSWNVNGIRAILKKGDFTNWVNHQKPAILCIQESKAQSGQYQFEDSITKNYTEYSFSAKKKGYSGTIILTNNEKVNTNQVIHGINNSEFDDEGRVLTIITKKFALVNVYRPSTVGNFEVRLPYRVRFDECFTNYLKMLKLEIPIIVCGDHNVAHHVCILSMRIRKKEF
jgi:exodeoxyribonuclease-3